MFPNDDICNVDAAKNAAQRLFRRYRSRGGREDGGLGKEEVNRLMRATYEAINMPYNPNEEDVFSFMGVFDSNNDGKIELQDLEQMAVKYLCGTDLLQDLSPRPSAQKQSKEEANSTERVKGEPRSIASEKVETSEARVEEKPKKRLTIEVAEPEEHTPLPKIYTPASSFKPPPPMTSFYSPRQKVSFKDCLSPNTDSTSLKSEFNTPKQKLSQPEVLRRGKEIFNQHCDLSRGGLVESSAGRVLSETYELFGKRSFNPSAEDVKIWMKLCDKNKDSLVEWADYEYFLLRTYERESQSTSHTPN